MEQENTKQRTILQNKSIHLWFTQVAEALNESGYDFRKTIKPNIDVPWSPQMVKDYMWRPILLTMFKKQSTADMKTDEVTKVWEVLNRHLGEKLGIHVPFPSVESENESLNHEQ